MRICFITPYPLRTISGVSTVVTALCKGLKKRNIDHLVISGRLTDEIKKDKAIEAIEIDVSRFSNLRDTYLAIKTIINILRYRRNFDLLHLHSPHLQPMLSAIMGKILWKPVIATIHGKFPRPKSALKRFYFWTTLKGTIAFSDKITFVDEEALKHYNIASGEVIENGIDTERFSPNSESREKKRDTLRISKDEVVLLFLGRLVAHKGVYDLLDAFSAVKNTTREKLRLIIIGSGEAGKLLEKIKALRLENEVIFPGKVKEVRDYYRASDIFVLFTSPLEGLPMALLEASSCGLAIISTRVSGIPAVIKDNENGLLLEYGDSDGLIKKIKMMIEDEKLRGRFGKNARKSVVERHNMDMTVDRYLSLYKKLYDDKRP